MILKLQKYLSDLVTIWLSIVRVVILSKFKVRLPKKLGDTVYILGNGPSLKDTLKENFDKLKNEPTFVVNNFLFSDDYEKIKPFYYILNAPEYFVKKAPTEFFANMREQVFNGLVERTSWKMTLFVPVLALKTNFWKKKLSQNKNIKIVFYNTTPVEGPQWFVNLFFSKNYGMARPHNVLIPSLFLALNMGYKKVFIFGADHSWIEEVKIDENNTFTVNHEHFYDSQKVILPMYKLEGQKYYFHDALRKWYLTFKGYFVIKKYAEHKGAEIYNASKKSYIDAFKKINF